MTQDVVLLGDKTLSLLARNLNVDLRQVNSSWNVVDGGYDTWLLPRLHPNPAPDRKTAAAWAFVLSPRALELVPDIAVQIKRLLERLAGLNSPPTVLFSNLYADPMGVMPLSNNLERQTVASRVNALLAEFREEHAWFHLVDHMGLALQHGVNALHDPRFEATAQLYYSPSGTRLLGALWLRALRSLERPQKKVCVVDLDNTLWHGVLGEDGAGGLQMADSGIGLAYRRFQRALLELRRNGILLAVCSKNNRDEAMAVLESHPDCLLRARDFAHIEIGWGLKSEGLARTAESLSLGLDSFVFIDDSPVEREEVTRALPVVDVFTFPNDPIHLSTCLSEYPGFDVLRRTEEDHKRADSYLEEAQRNASRKSAGSPEEFYRSLKLKVAIFSARAEQAVRLHQLVVKTNQFNLTGERMPAEKFRALLGDPGYLVVGLRVMDRFGDSGISGLAIVDRNRPDAWVVQNLLLSCRVIGRTVEYAFLTWLLGVAAKAGVLQLTLRFVPTGRNEVARNFLEGSGGMPGNGGWSFDVARPDVMPAHFVQIDDSRVT